MLKMNRAGLWAIAGLLAVSAVSADAGQRRGRDDRDRRDRAEKRWGSGEIPRAGVCLYENSNFRGQYFCVESDEDLSKMPRDMRDRISSIRIIGNVGAIVFRDEKFKGPSGRFLTDVGDLRRQGWNDQISSIRVTKTAAAWAGGRFPAWGRESLPREGACFYRDKSFKGDYFCVPRGGSYAEVPSEFNDKISSVRLIRASGVLVFADRDFEGRVAPLSSSVADLRRGVWNDKISSFRVF